MIYWLLIFVWDVDGNFVERDALPTPNKEECISAAAEHTMYNVNNTSNRHTYFCVTDDHWTGKDVDPGIPLDLLGDVESDVGDV